METSQAIQRLIELDKKKEEIKKYYEDLQETLAQVREEIGVDGFFQDPESGSVFQITVPEGRFVHYEPLTYVRTKKDGETRGTLSMKKAQEAGFDV